MRRNVSPLIRPLFQFGLLALFVWMACIGLSLPLQIDWLSAMYWTVLAPWIACVALLALNWNERAVHSSLRQRGPWMLTVLASGSRRGLNARRRGSNRRCA